MAFTFVLVAKICVGRRTWNALYAEIQSAPHAEIYDLFLWNAHRCISDAYRTDKKKPAQGGLGFKQGGS
jgi:hypothetical protein